MAILMKWKDIPALQLSQFARQRVLSVLLVCKAEERENVI